MLQSFAPSISVVILVTMEVYWKSRRSDNLSILHLCPYMWIFDPFTARNMSFPDSFHLSEWETVIIDIRGPLRSGILLFSFLSIVWKSRIEFEMLRSPANE